MLWFYLTPRPIPGPEDEFACPIIVYSTVLLKKPQWFHEIGNRAASVASFQVFQLYGVFPLKALDIRHNIFGGLIFECEVTNKYISIFLFLSVGAAAGYDSCQFNEAAIHHDEICWMKQHEHNSIISLFGGKQYSKFND